MYRSSELRSALLGDLRESERVSGVVSFRPSRWLSKLPRNVSLRLSPLCALVSTLLLGILPVVASNLYRFRGLTRPNLIRQILPPRSRYSDLISV